jgi:protein involved in polysaccharide export with SLBB domain
MLLASLASSGCASFSNPTAHASIPVHRLPPEVFGRPREEEKTIPLTLLRQKQVEQYRLDAGDVLGIYIYGILSDERQPVPAIIPPQYINYGTAESRQLPPAVGTPIVVQDNGTISLPFIDPIDVRGKTILEVEKLIRDAYSKADLLKRDKSVIVSLARQRTYHVTVIRQDFGGQIQSGSGNIVSARRGTGVPLDLPAGDNDVLTALARSGGLPGLDASNTVVVQRGNPPEVEEGSTTVAQASATQEQIRIPLRMRPEDPLPFKPEDIILRNGDIVFIESRETELYYTGGLLPVGEYILPRDYDLDCMEALTQTRGPLFNGGVNFNNFQGNIFVPGMGFPSPSLLTIIRKTPGCGQIIIRVDLNRAAVDPRERVLIKPGDYLILQETIGESFTRYFTTTFRIQFFFQLFQRQQGAAQLTPIVP